MTMKIGALLILAGLGCFVAFNLLGSTLDAQGFLHEPFAAPGLSAALHRHGAHRDPLLRKAHQGAMTQTAKVPRTQQ